MKDCIITEKYGKLSIEKVFVESYFPIVFTCTNENKQLFLVVCCMNNKDGCKWLIGKTDSDTIISLLKDKITVRDALLKSIDRISVSYVNGEYKTDTSDKDFCADSIYLPKHDSFMYAEDDEFAEEIEFYSSKNSIVYGQDTYKSLIDLIDNLYNEMIPIVEDNNKLSSSIENFSISNELINTLVELKDLCFSCSSRIKTYNESFKQVSSIKMCTEEKNQKINNIDDNTSIAA